MNKSGVSFWRFIFDCICKFFDCVVGNSGPGSSENYKTSAVSIIGVVLFIICMFGTLFFIDRKFNLKSAWAWLISIVGGIAVSIGYFAIAYFVFLVR